MLTRVSSCAQFDQINEAFEMLHAGKCLRVVLSL